MAKKGNFEYIPLSYSQLNLIEGTFTPSSINVHNCVLYQYWERTLFQRVQAKIKINGWLDAWNGFGVKDFFYFLLLARGYLGVRDIPNYGLVFNPCTVGSSLNIFYQPTEALFADPMSGSLERKYSYKIYDPNDKTTHDKKTSCAIVKFAPDLKGVWDVISHYAEQLALMNQSTVSSIISAKLAKIMGASTKAGAEALKQAIDQVNKGDIAVVIDKRFLNPKTKGGERYEPISVFEYFNTNNYLTNLLLQDTASILSAFDTEIGIVSLPYQKKERFVTNEADSKQEESQARLNLWIDTINESLKSVNKLFGTNLSATVNEFGKDGVNDGKNNIVGLGTLPKPTE